MAVMAIDPTKNTRVLLTLPHELVQEVEEYRRRQARIPSRSEAFRALIRTGLKAEERGESKPRRRKPV